MEQALTPILPAGELAIARLSDSAREYVAHSKSPRTLRAYQSDWNAFTEFCLGAGFQALPALPQVIALWLTKMADDHLKPATLSRRLAAVSKMHSARGFSPSPTAMSHACVKEVWDGIRRVKGTLQTAKAAVTSDRLKLLLEQVAKSLLGVRDRAMLLLRFAAALRCSELVALHVEDVEFVPEGLVLTIRKSKTDQEGLGERIGVHNGRAILTCPVRALKDWIAAAQLTSGPLFRSITRHGRMGRSLTDQVVAKLVKKYAHSAGLDHTLFSGHSLRSGCATSAAISGASERKIMDQTRHRSVAMVRRYIRDGNLFRDNISGQLGL